MIVLVTMELYIDEETQPLVVYIPGRANRRVDDRTGSVILDVSHSLNKFSSSIFIHAEG